jgi:hypothetical protein
MKTETKHRVAIYARVSCEEHANEGVSVEEAQVAGLRGQRLLGLFDVGIDFLEFKELLCNRYPASACVL